MAEMHYLLRIASTTPHTFPGRIRNEPFRSGTDPAVPALGTPPPLMPTPPFTQDLGAHTRAHTDQPGSPISGHLTPISTPLGTAWPTCPPDWGLEVTRAGHSVQSIDSSFGTLLKTGLFFPAPPHAPQADLGVPSSG